MRDNGKVWVYTCISWKPMCINLVKNEKIDLLQSGDPERQEQYDVNN